MTTILTLDSSYTPSDGEILVYNAAAKKWLPGTAPSGGGDVAELDARYALVVEHGTNANVARPATANLVIWVGTAQPTNAQAADIWDNETGVTATTYIKEPATEGSPGYSLTTNGAGVRSWSQVSGGAGGTDPWIYNIATVDTPNNTVSPVNITGLTIPALTNGLWIIETCILAYTGNVSNGTQLGVDTVGSTGATLVAVRGLGGTTSGGLGAQYPGTGASFILIPTGGPATASAYVGAEFLVVVRALSMTGTITFNVRAETAGGGSGTKADSFLRYRRIGS